MKNRLSRRILLENSVIGALGLLALLAVAVSFMPAMRCTNHLRHLLEVGSMAARLFSVLLLILLYNLYQRRRVAWGITLFLLGISLLRHFLPGRRPFWPVAVPEALFLVLLFFFRKDFCCPSSPASLRRSLLTLGAAAAGILLNAGISYHFARLHTPGMPRGLAVWESLRDACGILFGVYEGSASNSPLGRFETGMFWFSWGCMLLALLLALRPWLERFFWTEAAMRRARKLVLAYGQNPASYLTLEQDKLLYFGRTVEGVLPYGIVGSTVVVNGDPICAPEHFGAFLEEFAAFCRQSDHKLFFLSITGRYLDEYKKAGFGVAKCGEEARFDLANYEISGKKGAKMRMNINHAAKAGVAVHEYRPLEHRDPALEAALAKISAEWLADKKSGLLRFTMGTVGLENPMDRRYFYAADASGTPCAFNVYCPYDGGRGYMADITRRTHDAPGGVTEKIMYEAFRVFKGEGVQTASLGLAPLANLLPEGARPNSVEWLLNFVFEHLNAWYGFKNLYRAKENYSPTAWVPGYYAWLPRIPTPAMFYAVVRIQTQESPLAFARSVRRARRNAAPPVPPAAQ